LSGLQVVPADVAQVGLLDGSTLMGIAVCPSPKRAIAGGYQATGAGGQLTQIESSPASAGWRVTLRNNTGANLTAQVGMRVYVVCANVQ
jgi:hypothetical protein